MSMMHKGMRFWLLAAMISLMAGHPARGVGVGASAKVGTLGPGGDVTLGLSDAVSLRAGLNILSYSADIEDEEDVENINIKLKLQTVPVLLDWHPYKSNFRLSAGALINSNKVTLDADPGAVIEINDVEYGVDRLEGELSFDRYSPYLGIGYGNAARGDQRLVFSFDLGLMYHGAPDLEAQATASNPAQQAALDRDLDAELEDVRDDLRSFKLYPVLSFGLSYRF